MVPDLLEVFRSVTNQGLTLHPLNSSYIVLLQKKESATKPQDYRPISLVHAVQKIFSKILANRIQHTLKDLIDETQTDFIQTRQITEGFVYTQQVLHHLHKTNTPMAVFKADMNKAFDTIGWQFLLKVMHSMGFPHGLLGYSIPY